MRISDNRLFLLTVFCLFALLTGWNFLESYQKQTERKEKEAAQEQNHLLAKAIEDKDESITYWRHQAERDRDFYTRIDTSAILEVLRKQTEIEAKLDRNYAQARAAHRAVALQNAAIVRISTNTDRLFDQVQLIDSLARTGSDSLIIMHVRQVGEKVEEAEHAINQNTARQLLELKPKKKQPKIPWWKRGTQKGNRNVWGDKIKKR
ncbi:hypothetical protein SAMN05421823_102521 [Catalinimonas alkaloidigena]|uniref:Uncharacterized protein n=1 Tax=Catalinimonas alkaloidigena TaxID=1075417 RepID=A0A1G9B5S5_9BACT|nr:hypothetical protein [Catalinimonas alkaloidigena]SDK34843.1 hypothetical protein SAMN05421823_102521 [Catalinimonas alkaloidigena]